ncbi:MAG: hypothetical protein R3C05_15345 [Pirellulaceae bacterium]
MPIELPVVISQATAANGSDRQLEEDLIARLMLDESADVRLVGALQTLQPGGTDQLMLEGIAGEFAMLTWQPADQALQRLRELGIGGRRAAHRDDPTPPEEAGRRIYIIDLSNYRATAPVIESLKSCSADRRTKTIQIGLPIGRRDDHAVQDSKPVSTKASSPSTDPAPLRVANSTAPVNPQAYDDWAENAMESLVDELDQMDL